MQLVPFGEFVPFKQPAVLRRAARRGRRRLHAGRRADGARRRRPPRRASRSATSRSIRGSRARSCGGAASCWRRSRTTRGSAGRRRPISTSSRAALRAVEEGRYVVRAANTGISGAVDPYGRDHRPHRPVRAGGDRRLTCGCSTGVRSTAASATSSPGCRSRSPPACWSLAWRTAASGPRRILRT